MVKLRGMHLSTFAIAYAAGLRTLPVPKHVFICVGDHYEPDWNGADQETQIRRVDRWVHQYPSVVQDCVDSRGRPPQHTFFYPIECYEPILIEKLATLVRAGFGDIEVHLHHDDDHSDALRNLLTHSTQVLFDRHGLLRKNSSGQIQYGFIHGNWALDNSHPDGRWCGVNDELTILRQTGCYADFTMPAAPHPAQTRTINSLYYAIDDPEKPKSHDRGILAKVGATPPEPSLLMIQGPLVVNHPRPWKKPKVENGNVSKTQPLNVQRLDSWLRAGVSVDECPDWHFLKLHTHGAPESNADVWLGDSAKTFHQQLAKQSRLRGFRYYYVTAYEMAKLVHQAEAGNTEPDFDQL